MKSAAFRVLCVFAFLLALPLGMASAQSADPFEYGWNLDGDASELRFLSVKKSKIAETSSFATLSGLITENGQAQVRVLLDSVDTKVDLRNVRMRFLFFETFKFPEAIITAELNPELLTDLHMTRRKEIELPYSFTLRGVTLDRTTDVAVTLIDNDRVVVSSITPIAFTLEELDLEEGRMKLQEAANVDITPVGVVSFNFVFNRAQPGTPPDIPEAVLTPAAVALETKGDMSEEACRGRFEILSKTGNIFFASGSTRLDDKSIPLLENLYDIVNRCPGFRLEIAGHTDSIGSDQQNQVISERRAASVRTWLLDKGIPSDRMAAVGYGEARPIVSNDTPQNRARNRRIEFTVLN
ncbi:OmpA family protein [Marivita hallyeonensis]|uniref:Outer membrane protein OmpA n=1 Tax=Marivita hallyeonensis TaxID=996342 RepID=A0A1M5PGB2_9RHOB|nr:OmpA family protein [Marivita hallyeonensis]SHH00751.1 Outer membrane protein OmpA [Marivita hallyeonensis]